MSPTDCEPLQLITVKGLWLILQAPSLVPLLLYLSIWKFPSSGSVLASITGKTVHCLSVYWFQPPPIPPPRRDPPKKICVSSAPEHPVWMWGLSFSPHVKCHELVPRLDNCYSIVWYNILTPRSSWDYFRKRSCSSCHSTTGRVELCMVPTGFLLLLKH